MSRYIDTDKLTNRAYQLNFDKKISERELAIVNRLIGGSPTEDVAPVVRAHWEDIRGNFVEIDSDGSPKDSCWCSHCHEWLVASDEYEVFGYYCPYCGARMDLNGEDNENEDI